MTDPAEQLIAEEEGRERTVYPDSLGYESIGIGACVDKRVRGAGLCDAAIDAQFAHDRANADAVCARLPGFAALNDVQKAALTSVAFQLGDAVLGWRDFMAAMRQTPPDVKAAGAALRDSKWATVQTPERADRECTMLETGEWQEHKA